MRAPTAVAFVFDRDVDDRTAIKRGERAATRILSGATLREHLEIGDALLRLKRAALVEAGLGNAPVTGRAGSAVNTLFSEALAKHPKLGAIDEKLRTAAMKCAEHWEPTGRMVIAELEQSDPKALQTIGARGFAERIAAKLTEGLKDELPKEKKLKPDKWAGVEETLKAVGVHYRNRDLAPVDWDRVVAWLVEKGMPPKRVRELFERSVSAAVETAAWAATPEIRAKAEADIAAIEAEVASIDVKAIVPKIGVESEREDEHEDEHEDEPGEVF
jgi:hypothetical protein